MADTVRSSGIKKKIAVAWAQDPNTVGSLHRAVTEGFAEAIMIGRRDRILAVCQETGADPQLFTLVESPDEKNAAELAVSFTRNGEVRLMLL